MPKIKDAAKIKATVVAKKKCLKMAEELGYISLDRTLAQKINGCETEEDLSHIMREARREFIRRDES